MRYEIGRIRRVVKNTRLFSFGNVITNYKEIDINIILRCYAVQKGFKTVHLRQAKMATTILVLQPLVNTEAFNQYGENDL